MIGYTDATMVSAELEKFVAMVLSQFATTVDVAPMAIVNAPMIFYPNVVGQIKPPELANGWLKM
jgi:hypothetical protein